MAKKVEKKAPAKKAAAKKTETKKAPAKKAPAKKGSLEKSVKKEKSIADQRMDLYNTKNSDDIKAATDLMQTNRGAMQQKTIIHRNVFHRENNK